MVVCDAVGFDTCAADHDPSLLHPRCAKCCGVDLSLLLRSCVFSPQSRVSVVCSRSACKKMCSKNTREEPCLLAACARWWLAGCKTVCSHTTAVYDTRLHGRGEQER